MVNYLMILPHGQILEQLDLPQHGKGFVFSPYIVEAATYAGFEVGPLNDGGIDIPRSKYVVAEGSANVLVELVVA
jgi:hypothetical protein